MTDPLHRTTPKQPLTQTEQRVMDAALRRSIKFVPHPHTDLLKRTHDAIDAILRGKHDGWDRALDAVRKELQEALNV